MEAIVPNSTRARTSFDAEGTVYEPDGSPADNAQVTVRRIASEPGGVNVFNFSGGGRAKTNRHGAFTLKGLTASRYRVMLRQDGGSTLATQSNSEGVATLHAHTGAYTLTLWSPDGTAVERRIVVGRGGTQTFPLRIE